MNAARLRIDLFAVAIGALAVLTLVFFDARNGGAVLTSTLCIAALLTARALGFSNRALVLPAATLVAILWMVWMESPVDDRTVSAVAHFAGGAVIAWAIADFLRHRLSGIAWAAATLATVVALTVLWELFEYVGDLVFTTSLDPNRLDSALDITFGIVGAVMALALTSLLVRPGDPKRTHAIP